MLNFTQQTVINSSDRFKKIGTDTLRIKRIGDYKKANIKSVFKTVASDPVKGTAAITPAALTLGAGDYRLVVYLRLQKSVNSLYANDLVYKGKPLFFEFKGRGTTADDITAMVKAINSQQRM